MGERVIWKWPVPTIETFDLDLPQGAKVIHLAWQGEQGPQLWAICDPDAEKEPRRFRVFGTGLRIDTKLFELHDYIGTFQGMDGRFIWHLFEVKGAGDAGET